MSFKEEYNDYDDGESQDADFEPYAQQYLGTEAPIPFFGEVLGDCFGWARDTFYRSANGRTQKAICIWYDVPADLDFTIDSTVNKVCDWLKAQGYTASGVKEGAASVTREFAGETYNVGVENSDMLYIYVFVPATDADVDETV